MTKIEFLDNNEPPLSASNLNAIQDNTETAINSVQSQVNGLLKNATTSSTDYGYNCSFLNGKIIEESGSNANGTWIKYGDGTMIITQQYSSNVSSWSSWGSMYTHDLDTPPSYPQTFLNRPAVSVTTSHSGSNFWIYDRGLGGSTTISPYIGVVRPNNPGSGTTTVVVFVIAIGRWK